MRYLTVILILLAGLAPAATVDFSTLLPTGAASTLPITITPLIKLSRSGTNLVAGIPLTVRPTNGPCPVALLGGLYQVSIAGSGATTTIPVPSDEGSYSAASLATNLVTFLYTNQVPLVSGIIVGTGMTGSTNGGVVTLTATAQTPAGVVTNGQANVSFGNVTATAVDGAVTTPNLLTDTIQSKTSGFVDVPATMRTTEDGSFDGAHTGTFSGDGSGLTGLNAGSLGGGTVPLVRLTSVGTNLAGAFLTQTNGALAFTLNAGALSNVNLTTATGVLPMGTLTTNAVNVTNGFLQFQGAAGRQYTRDLSAGTNLSQIMGGAVGITFSDNTEKFAPWQGSLASGGETLASSSIPLAGSISRAYFNAGTAPGSGTNFTFKIYTNGTFCGITSVLASGQTVTNDLSNVARSLPAGTLVSVGIKSSYNGAHLTVYFKWSWVFAN